MILKSFGDSFIFGNDLHDDGRDTAWGTPSQHTWPALLAQSLKCTYACYAQGGVGNLLILERVLLHASTNDTDCIYVIGWTYSSRFDYVTDQKYLAPRSAEQYIDLWTTLRPNETHAAAVEYYSKYQSPYQDKLQTLIWINMAIHQLQKRNIPFIMTLMDPHVFDQTWDAPLHIRDLQAQAESHIQWFDNKDFLTWSQQQGFEISANNHPLEPAHQAAHDMILPICERLI